MTADSLPQNLNNIAVNKVDGGLRYTQSTDWPSNILGVQLVKRYNLEVDAFTQLSC